MSKVIITEKGVISKETMDKLVESGYIVIVAKDVSKVRLLGDVDFMTGSDLFMAAMKGANDSNISRSEFTQELYRRLQAKEKNSKPDNQ